MRRGVDAEIRFFVAPKLHKRLFHQAREIGCSMGDIARDGTVIRLDQLEAQAAARAQPKKQLVPDLKEHGHDKPKGLGGDMLNPHIQKPVKVPSALQPVKTVSDFDDKEDVPAKIKKSFPRYAKYIEQGKDESEKENRAQFVASEISERLDGDEDKTRICVAALGAFMEGRAEAKATAPTDSPPKVDDTAKVAGDVDDED